MKKKALLKLADYLETHDFKKEELGFDMREWYCGTAACAIGHAIVTGIAPKGLRLEYSITPNEVFPRYNIKFGIDAVAAAYNITNTSARFLFLSPLQIHPIHPTPKQVAKRIRNFVENSK